MPALRSVTRTIRLRPQELEAVRRAAEIEDSWLGEFMRRAVVEAAARVLERERRAKDSDGRTC